jgi:hypothetical protein
MHAVLKKILVLNDELQLIVNDFLAEAKPTNQTQLYCAQIRTKEKRTPKSDVIKFFHFMNKEFIGNNSNDYRIFITTNDIQTVYKTIHSFIDKSKIVKPKSQLTNGIQDVHVGYTKIRNNCTVVEPSIIDFQLLQYCDKIINSESGFGIFGSLNKQDPFKDFYVYTFEELIWKPEYRWYKDLLKNGKYAFMKIEDFRRLKYSYRLKRIST